jgi:hypothetical protein
VKIQIRKENDHYSNKTDVYRVYFRYGKNDTEEGCKGTFTEMKKAQALAKKEARFWGCGIENLTV